MSYDTFSYLTDLKAFLNFYFLYIYIYESCSVIIHCAHEFQTRFFNYHNYLKTNVIILSQYYKR